MISYEIFLIFITYFTSNILGGGYILAFSQCNMHTTGHGNRFFSDLAETQIPLHKPYQDYLERNQEKRYSISLSEPSPLSLTLDSSVAVITMSIYFNQTINLSQFITNSTNFALLCAPRGKFDVILLTLVNANIQLSVRLKQKSSDWPLLNMTALAKVRYHNRSQRRQIMIKWEKSKLDIHAMNYCVAINTRSPLFNLCQATESSLAGTSKNICNRFVALESLLATRSENIKKIDFEGTTIACTGNRSQQIFRRVIPGNFYYIDVFAIHTGNNNLSFHYGSTKILHNKMHSISLLEGKSHYGKFSDLGGVSIFNFKIPKTSQPNQFQLYLVPCGGAVSVKVFKQKQKVLGVKNIYKSSIVKIAGARPGDRYIIRVSPSNEDEFSRVNRVEITAITTERFAHLPLLPPNTSVSEITSLRNCKSSSIVWFSSRDSRKIRYCVTILKLQNHNKEAYNSRNQNFCGMDNKLQNNPDFQQMHCYYPVNKTSEMESFKIVGLSPSNNYMAYVTVSLLSGRSFSYEPLRIATESSCTRVFQKTQTQLPRVNNSFYMDKNFIRPDYKMKV